MKLLTTIISQVLIVAGDKLLDGFLFTCGGLLAAKWFGVL
jgi:hypothetical protein